MTERVLLAYLMTKSCLELVPKDSRYPLVPVPSALAKSKLPPGPLALSQDEEEGRALSCGALDVSMAAPPNRLLRLSSTALPTSLLAYLALALLLLLALGPPAPPVLL